MWADRLIIEYENGKKELLQKVKELGSSETDMADKAKLRAMVRDMNFTIEWLKIGREPSTMRGIERRSVYQRTSFSDMDLYPSLELDVSRPLSDAEKEKVIKVLLGLSVRERQCYILNNAYGLSMNEIAKELEISKSSVQVFIKRAKKKIAERK